ncbi:hypothetical protein J3Q64DRAFT_1306324 [Phycomyces blakesleeanus]|uniref:Uncharacterized protein n=1 Tax=Phycomyces blakesleeanus TaxID=4837 RepID=A0ABR3AKT1_PHYBL
MCHISAKDYRPAFFFFIEIQMYNYINQAKLSFLLFLHSHNNNNKEIHKTQTIILTQPEHREEEEEEEEEEDIHKPGSIYPTVRLLNYDYDYYFYYYFYTFPYLSLNKVLKNIYIYKKCLIICSYNVSIYLNL